MLFITNRQIAKEDNAQIPRMFTFLLEQNAPTQEIFFGLRNTNNNYDEIGSSAFLQSLRQLQYKQILLYIHGYNCLPENDVFPAAKILQDYFDQLEQHLVLVVPIIWPCSHEIGLIKDYWNDQMSADMSSFSFKRVLDLFQAWSKNSASDRCYKFINILAHSMGNRVLRETLQAWHKYSLPQGIPKLFRNIFLIAADLNNATLEYKERGEIICHSSRNVLVYHANDDLVLRASKVINEKNMVASVRLGQTGPENIDKTPKNVYVVDCDEINNKYDFPKGHTYFLSQDTDNPPNLIIAHMYAMFKTGRFTEDTHNRKIILK